MQLRYSEGQKKLHPSILPLPSPDPFVEGKERFRNQKLKSSDVHIYSGISFCSTTVSAEITLASYDLLHY